jgi:hypothetical protein
MAVPAVMSSARSGVGLHSNSSRMEDNDYVAYQNSDQLRTSSNHVLHSKVKNRAGAKNSKPSVTWAGNSQEPDINHDCKVVGCERMSVNVS